MQDCRRERDPINHRVEDVRGYGSTVLAIVTYYGIYARISAINLSELAFLHLLPSHWNESVANLEPSSVGTNR